MYTYMYTHKYARTYTQYKTYKEVQICALAYRETFAIFLQTCALLTVTTTFMCLYTFIYIYIYIYRERERVYVDVHNLIHIYICIHV
jgi:hypothetical protein